MKIEKVWEANDIERLLSENKSLKDENEKLIKELLETNQKHQELNCNYWKCIAEKMAEALKNITSSDDKERMWFLAEESLAFFDAKYGEKTV